jgi:tetratricopeptide (TPR) repeat protein
MNSKLKLSILLAGFMLLSVIPATAQKSVLSGIDFRLTEAVPDSTRPIGDWIKQLEKAKTHPKTANTAKMWFLRGRVYLIAFQQPKFSSQYPDALNQAYTSFMKALETDAKDKYSEDIKSYYILNTAIGKFNAGIQAFEAENWSQALQAFSDVEAIINIGEDVKKSLETYNISKEKIIEFKYYTAQRKGDMDMAKKLIQGLIDENYYKPTIYVDMARIYLAEKDTAKALEYIALGKETFETNRDLINMELDLYLKQGRSEELITKLSKAIESDPGNKIYYFARAISYEGLKKYDKAQADYEAAIEIDPNYFDAYYNLGVLHYNKANPVIEKLNEAFDEDEINKLDAELKKYQLAALEQFEFAFQTPGVEVAEKLQLAQTMLELYKRTRQKEKAQAMQDYINENSGE